MWRPWLQFGVRAMATNKTKLVALVGAGACALLVDYVPQAEGMILRGYRDPIGIVTACAGHTKTAMLGRAYTLAECNTLLVDDLAEHAKGIGRCVKLDAMTTGQRAAFVSFAYNVGTGAFCGSTMARMVNAGNMAGACAQLSRWTYAGGKQLPGLVKRRATERAMCEGRIA